MSRDWLPPSLIIAAMLSISCAARPFLHVTAVNDDDQPQAVEIRAKGEEWINLHVDLPPGGYAAAGVWGESPSGALQTSAEYREMGSGLSQFRIGPEGEILPLPEHPSCD